MVSKFLNKNNIEADNDNAAKEKARKSLQSILKMETGVFVRMETDALKKMLGSLTHTDVNKESHCYLLEYAREMREEIVQKNEILEEALEASRKPEMTQEGRAIISKVLQEEAKNDNALQDALKKTEMTQKDRGIINIALQEKARKSKENVDLLTKLYKLDMELSEILTPNQSLQEFVGKQVVEMLEVRKKTGSGLQAALSQEQDLQKVYKPSTTETDDQRYFNEVFYPALAENVREKRDKSIETLYNESIRLQKFVRAEGVKLGLRAAGLVAVGVTSGGIGIGVALLGQVTGMAIAAGHEAWLKKYYQVPEEQKKYLDNPEALAKFYQGEIDALEALKIKRDHVPEGKGKEFLEGEIKRIEENILKIKDSEKEAKEAAMKILADLIASGNPAAIEFFDGFEQQTRELQKEAKGAVAEFRVNAHQRVNLWQGKLAKAVSDLNAIEPSAAIKKEKYNELMYNVLVAKAAVADAEKDLDTSYHILLEAKRRDALYVDLATALKKGDQEREERLGTSAAVIDPTDNVKKKIGKQAKAFVQKKDIPVKEAISNILGSAAGTILGQDGLGDMLNVSEALREGGVQAAFHNLDFQKHVIAATLTTTKQLANKFIAPELEKMGVQGSLEKAYDYLNEHLGTLVTQGVSSAHLAHDISPAGICTMLALFAYTGIHNKVYGDKLKGEFLKIQEFLDKHLVKNNGDISTLSDTELKELQNMLGEIIDKFPKVLPETMNKDLEESKKLYDAQVKRTQLLNKATRFYSFRIVGDGDVKFRAALNIANMENDPRKITVKKKFNKKKVYIEAGPKGTKLQDAKFLIAYSYDDKKKIWVAMQKSKEEFDRQKFPVTPGEYKNVEEVEKVAKFFGCERLSATKMKKLLESKEELDRMHQGAEERKKAKEEQEQMVYQLTGLYRGITNRITTKDNLQTTDRCFELSRQRELMAILEGEGAGISAVEYEKALPLVQRYVRNRKKIIDTLNMIKELKKDALTPDAQALLTRYEDALLKTPYEFLKEPGSDFENLEKNVKLLSSNLEEIKSSALEALENVNIKISEEEYEEAFPLISKYLSDRKKTIDKLKEMVELETLMGVDARIPGKESNKDLLNRYQTKTPFLEEPNKGEGLEKLKNKVDSVSDNFKDVSGKMNELKKNKNELVKGLAEQGVKIPEEDYATVFPLTQAYLSDRKEMVACLKQIAELEKMPGVDANTLDKERNSSLLKTYETGDSEKPYKFLKVVENGNHKELDLADLRNKVQDLSKNLAEMRAKVNVLKEQAAPAENVKALPVQETAAKQAKPSGIRRFLLRVFEFFRIKRSASAQASQIPEASSQAVDSTLQARAAALAGHTQLKQPELPKNAETSALILSPKPEALSFPTEPVQPGKVAKTVKTRKSGPH